MQRLPHPVTGELFDSPVPPGTGWPDDHATARTPVAEDAADVRRLAAATSDLGVLDAYVSVCRACPRLVAWREEVAVTKRAAYADQPYWGRPSPSFGDPDPQILVVGLAPAAHGANRTGRMFTGDRSGDWLYAALYRAGYASQPSSVAAGDGLTLRGVRIVPTAHCAPPANTPTPVELATCAGWFDRDLQLALPLRSVLALGGIAWSGMLRAAKRLGWGVDAPAPRFGHGAETVLRTPRGDVRMVGSYHVSQQNTFTGRLTEEMLDAVIARLGASA
ncbi:MAG TPA: uracil-DNA glycosylase [Propionibacteriaceae bacterium]|nr:uracil-DNA glycosylase [Propionibacteriaceae bacterium]